MKFKDFVLVVLFVGICFLGYREYDRFINKSFVNSNLLKKLENVENLITNVEALNKDSENVQVNINTLFHRTEILRNAILEMKEEEGSNEPI